MLPLFNIKTFIRTCSLAEEPNAASPKAPRESHPFSPMIDIYESNGNLIIDIELAGIERHDLSVLYKKGVLEISGRKDYSPQEIPSRYYIRERTYGTFKRVIYINDRLINADLLTADFKNGLLNIVIPKSDLGRTRKVEVKIA